MDLTTIALTPGDDLYDVLVHVPFTLTSDVLSDLKVVVNEIEGIDTALTYPVGEYTLRVNIARVVDNVDDVFGCVLMFIINAMNVVGMDDLRVTLPSSAPRELERRLTRILKQLAKDEWSEGNEQTALIIQAQIDELTGEVENTEREVLKLGQALEDIDQKLIRARLELVSAQEALRLEVVNGEFDEDRIVGAAMRIDVEKLAIGAHTVESDRGTQQSDLLAEQVVTGAKAIEQLEYELKELKAQKRPKFFVKSRPRHGRVVLTVVC